MLCPPCQCSRFLWVPSSCTNALKTMKRGHRLSLVLHRQPQTGLGLHGREGFALCPAARWVPCPYIGCCGLGTALEHPRGDCREAEEPRHLLDVFVACLCLQGLCSSNAGLFVASVFFSIAFAGGWGRGLLPATMHGAGTPTAHILYTPATGLPMDQGKGVKAIVRHCVANPQLVGSWGLCAYLNSFFIPEGIGREKNLSKITHPS